MNLLILNYSMNSSNQVFAHQREIAQKLSRHFSQVDVLTAEKFYDSPIESVNVVSTDWLLGQPIRNIYKFYKRAIPLLFKHRRGVVFSHMTDVQSMLIAPFCKILQIRHFLWYAHKSYSSYLRASHYFIDRIITSTPGSCPLDGENVFYIGQAVSLNIPSAEARAASIPPKRFYHVGRIDPSKNIETLIQALSGFATSVNGLQLHIYGAPSSPNSLKYFEKLKTQFSTNEYSGWVFFHGAVTRAELEDISMNQDCFIHAFWGSLDKSIVEAALLRRLIISANPEYLREFQGYKRTNLDVMDELNKQLISVFSSTDDILRRTIESNFEIAEKNHTLDGWIYRLLPLIRSRDRKAP